MRGNARTPAAPTARTLSSAWRGRRRAHDRSRRSLRLLPPRSGARHRGPLPPQRSDELGRLARAPRAHRRAGPGPARLRAHEQGRQSRLLAARLRRCSWSSSSTRWTCPRWSLVGHGWGAAIGLLFAERHPDRVTRLAIIDAVPLLEGFAVARDRRGGAGVPASASCSWDRSTAGWLARILRARQRHARGLARRARGRGVGAVRPGHPARDPQAAPLRRPPDAGGSRRGPRATWSSRRWCSGASRIPGCAPPSPTPTRRRLPHATVEHVLRRRATGRGSTSRRWRSAWPGFVA